ncbi:MULTISPECIES: HD-GYP domain-containing protein [unclassified Brenneria]|uniref:HD-GYP domain-containing protein n=1 Tax=unclassified Brenneria TaxID=2634434 RepID=UPI0018F061A1|nr:HD domain-containing phosphohydrolase [Brenneria sp. L3-3C-1]MBJ7221734.1 response regulator [Brenneria sp. L3-3C-1]MEE3642975.1 HD domain-containing phosphohydrolase [Brenneria sp. L3_3C_1]
MMNKHNDARILIVDDEAANLKVLEKLLSSEGYCRLVSVQDPRLVLRTYLEARPDLILLDINMPHIDGYQLMQQLKMLHDPLLPPIMVLTAEHGRERLLKALSAGARDYVNKPFDRTELLMRVRNLLDAHLAHRLIYEQNDVLEKMVRLRTRELLDTRLQVVRRLARAAEYRDSETGRHIMRMSHTCALLARQLGWSESDVELILHSSPMHDVGKIGIPDAILLKPDKLNAAEWEVMRQHTVIGAEILAGDDSQLMVMSRNIALTHHEKWNGDGYPGGLSGKDIPLPGRIVAVADVFDALVSERPYKPAWPHEQAIDYIKAQSGSHFDPEVVSAFMDILDGAIRIQEIYREAV